MNNKIVLLTCILSIALGACSRDSEPTPASAPPASAPPPLMSQDPPEPLSPDSLARLVRPHSPVLGVAKAPVTVVEVLDPACEACRAFAPVVHQLLFLYPDDVRVVVRFADFHPGSAEAIRLLEAARMQGKFEPMLDALFERQQEWAAHSAPDTARVWQIAGDIGVNVARARKDAQAASVDDLLRIEAEDLLAIKVERTPTFFVNGKPLPTFGDQQLLDLVASEVRNQKR
ncbi:MAG TPA: thioredoxin domain-containing protein [Steroidobacteraceae bacterium]|nr:thioredoxin domain-containing protein [Steroidobacteraceae bacterium]